MLNPVNDISGIDNYNGMREILDKFVTRIGSLLPVEGVHVEHYSPLLVKMMLEEAGEEVSLEYLETASGHSSFFAYDRLKPWVYDLDGSRNVFIRCLGVAGWEPTIYSPSDFEDAYRYLCDRIIDGLPIFIEFFEPMVVYGVDEMLDESLIHWFCAPWAPEGNAWSKEEMKENWWRWMDEDGINDLITLDSPAGNKPDPTEIAVETINAIVQRMNTKNIDDIPFGFKAYEAYCRDLRNESIDWVNENTSFVDEMSTVWGCWAIYHQWTPRIYTALYLEKASEHFNDQAKMCLQSAAELYKKCVKEWLEWEKLLGRDWEVIEDDELEEEDKQELLKKLRDEKWGDIENRKKAATHVEAAGDFEYMAVEELKKALEYI
jgi:hypothetical protein